MIPPFEQLNRAIELWMDITGTDPDSNYGSWDVHTANKDIQEAQKIDPTGVTAQMLLRYFADEYLKNKQFTADEMMENPDGVTTYLKKAKELKTILDSPELHGIMDDFIEVTSKALAKYGALREPVQEILKDRYNLAFIRRDALRAIDELTTHQFLHGEPDKDPPKYNEYLYEFWNVNSLVEAIASQLVSGISLVMIKTEAVDHAFFGFAVRNGGTLTLLTDRLSWPHPDAKYMTRNPGRHFEKRMYRLRFPYSLFDLYYDAKDKPHVKEKDTTALVPRQKKMHQLKEMTEMEPDEVIWTAMMFDLIAEKFWKRGFKTKQLAYTGEMVIENRALIDYEPTKALTVTGYQPLEVAPLTADDATVGILEWEDEPTGQHDWLEERYADKCKTDMLNLMHNQDNPKLPHLNIKGTDVVHVTDKSVKEFFEHKRTKTSGSLRALNASSFGTKDEIEFERKWAARYNKARIVRFHADNEFDKRKDEIKKWYKDHVRANKDKLLHAIAMGEFKVRHVQQPSGFRSGIDESERDEMSLHHMPDCKHYYDRGWGWNDVLLDYDNHEFLCLVTENKPTIVAEFTPTCPEALAALAGVDVDELPDVLQHWYRTDEYCGNQILDNVDPMEWVCENPWRAIKFRVSVFLSKRAYNDLRKAAGQPPNKFWMKKEDD